MAVSEQFNRFVLDLLGAIRPVSARRMFGGVGYYADGLFFAIADDDLLYFRVDAASRADYEAEGMAPFAPMGPGTKPMSYYAVPARLYDDEEALAQWLRRALQAAQQPGPATAAGKRARAGARTRGGRAAGAGRSRPGG